MHVKNLGQRKPKSFMPIIFIAILLALLIHIFLLYIIFVAQSDKQENLVINKITQNDAVQEKKQEKNKEELLSLPKQRAHASSLGQPQNQAQVILYEEPLEQKSFADFQSEEVIASEQSLVPQQTLPQKEIDSLAQAKKLQKSAAPDATPKKGVRSAQINASDQATGTEQIAISEQSSISKKQKPANPFLPTYGSHEQPENAQLQNMGKGFLEAMEKGGNDAMNMSGDKRMATDEEIKEISYMHRVIRALQSSFKSDAMWITLAYDEHVETKATIAIDSNGNISSLTIFNPPQNSRLDRHIRELIYRACPFAPIPKYLGHDTFNFQVRISISMSAGTHHMQWHCE